MKNKLLILLALVAFSLFPNTALAHTEQGQRIGNYIVGVAQDPLSPFVGEEVEVTFDLEHVPSGLNELRQASKPAQSVKGKLVIKEMIVNQYVGRDSEAEYKIIYEEESITDLSGTVGVAYTFKKEGLYDIEFIWGNNQETESAGREIFVREPTSYFLPQELGKRIWLFVGVALAGTIIGALCMFILLTITLHTKK